MLELWLRVKLWSRQPHIIFLFAYAIALHFLWGILFLFRPLAVQAVSIHGLSDLIDNPRLLGMSLICVAILALLALFQHRPGRFGALIVWQQVALTLSAIGSIRVIYEEASRHRLVGFHLHPSQVHAVEPIVQKFTDPWVLIASQAPTILIAIMHGLAIVYVYKTGFPHE